MSESYSERYERVKKLGATCPVIFYRQVDMSEERFLPVTNKEVPGVMEGRYFISNYGNVYDSLKDASMAQRDNHGYKYVDLMTIHGTKNMRVHRLEMLTFEYNPDYQSLQVNHIDGNPSNNKLSNLEWTTPKENTDHAMLYGLHQMNGKDNPNNKLNEKQVREICELIQTGKYYDTEIAEMYGVSYANISDIHKGKLWTNISKEYDLSNRKPLKLTPDQVREICEMLESGKYFTTEIGKKFIVSHQVIIQIRKGKIWTEISKDYNINPEKRPRKFTEQQIREMCELIQSGKYYDREIAAMYNTNGTMIGSLRKGAIHKEITKDYDLTVRKPQIRKVPLFRGDTQIN